MSKNLAIKVERLSKVYNLGEVGTGTLSRDLERWWARTRGKEDPFLKIGESNDRTKKGNSDIVYSLKDINFEIEKGVAVGIIGRNGAGKSTLLKILSRVTSPTTGKVYLNGRVASLLEVGTGFNPELTGRENIYVNGAILGMKKKEIVRKFDEIVDFAGVERYIDTPVKRYSSGMYVRLAFAVAAHLECEILIVDEVLAVGDAEFQQKCLGKMGGVMQEEGRTILFVSHNMSAVRSLCQKGIFLQNGCVAFDGEVNKTVNNYLNNNSNKISWSGEDGNDSLKLTAVKIFDETGYDEFRNGADLFVTMEFVAAEEYKDLCVGFTVNSVWGNPIASVFYNDFNDYTEIIPGTYEVTFCIPSYTLSQGDYELEFNLSIPYVRKMNTAKSNLVVKIIADNEIGNKFFIENDPRYYAIVRPNWFKYIKKIN